MTAVKNNAGPLGQDAVATLTRRALVPKSPEVFGHDGDGNLTADGQWSYTWDAENRLIAVETLPALVAPDGPLPADRKRRLEYLYDAQHRRIARKAYSWSASSGSWILGSEFRYLYDGWQVIAEFAYNSSTINLNASYAWGLDLSGTLQGAGGVGGLVFARLHNGATSVTHTAACDANGNMLAYYDAATGERTARFEYGPFGEPLVDDGAAAENLTYRFSTKPRDPLTGTYYYGYRHYAPTTGRWLNRDPIEEEGGVNLHGIVGNNPINVVDRNGLDGWTMGVDWVIGGRDRQFGPDDPETAAMARSEVVRRNRQELIRRLNELCKSGSKVGAFRMPMLIGLPAIPKWKYVTIRFPVDLMTNSTAAFVGSFTKNAWMDVASVRCCEGTARVHFHGENVTGLPSASHAPKDRQSYGPSLLPSNPFGPNGPMHDVTQIFDWFELVEFKK